jgi:hypothetical protein
MTRFLRRMAIAAATAAIPLTVVAVAPTATSWASCDPNWSRNVWTGQCHPPPAPPEWWTPRPAYAPPYAPMDVPPPPDPPPWAREQHPIWDEGSQQWVWVRM